MILIGSSESLVGENSDLLKPQRVFGYAVKRICVLKGGKSFNLLRAKFD